jgi:acetyl/propionyl-CoA carboxylase alpha subunit
LGVYRTTGQGYSLKIRMHRIRLQRIGRFSHFPIEEAVIVTTLKVPKAGGLPATKVNVVRWLKQEGERVKRGDAVVELETEKVNYELDSPTDGVLLKIIAREGAEVPVGDPVCHIGESGDTIP